MRLQERDSLACLVLARVEQVDLIFVNAEQRLPLVPLRLAPGDVGIKAPGNIAYGYAVMRLGDELPLFPQHLLEAFDLVQKVDDLVAN